jgi:hypothetical protein
MVVLWFLPFPIVIVVWLLDVKLPSGDVMLTATPLYLSIPVIGAVVNLLLSVSHERGKSRAKLGEPGSGISIDHTFVKNG